MPKVSSAVLAAGLVAASLLAATEASADEGVEQPSVTVAQQDAAASVIDDAGASPMAAATGEGSGAEGSVTEGSGTEGVEPAPAEGGAGSPTDTPAVAGEDDGTDGYPMDPYPGYPP